MAETRTGIESPNLPKKQRELRVMQSLRQLDAGCANGDFVAGVAGVEPDFVLVRPGRRIGIEIVEYFRPDTVDESPLKEQEYFADCVTAAATNTCKEAGLAHVFAIVDFDFTSRIRKHDVSPLASMLANLVAPVGLGREHKIEFRDELHLPSPIASVWACRRQTVPEPFVGREWGGNVPAIDLAHLDQVIESKERRLAIYRQQCAEVWLAILVDPFHIASMAYVPPDYRLRVSQFERVIVLQGWSHTVELWNAA
jgi:hypothetical protein